MTPSHGRHKYHKKGFKSLNCKVLLHLYPLLSADVST
jgi:hypothetical protein